MVINVLKIGLIKEHYKIEVKIKYATEISKKMYFIQQDNETEEIKFMQNM